MKTSNLTGSITTATKVVSTFKNFKASSSSEIKASGFGALNNWVKAALKDVSQQRSDLGAIQNRLEHTINNLDNVVENTTSAESAIRDTDMATEMVKYSNNNILAQAGQAMLAQANQSNQGVLSLLG
jgi:flagellin